MKKLATLVSFVLIAAWYGLSYTPTEDKAFDAKGAYSGKFHDEVDYKKLYEAYVTGTASSEDACDISKQSFQSKAFDGSSIDAGDTEHTWLSQDGDLYWFIAASDVDSYKLPKNAKVQDGSNNCQNGEYTFKDCKKKTLPIVAPCDNCEIITSARSSKHGTMMQVKINEGNVEYTITFNNMARWYCCADRKPTITEDPTAKFEHTEDAKGTVLRAGDLIGYATKKTKVTIKVEGTDSNNDSIVGKLSPYDFYTGNISNAQ